MRFMLLHCFACARFTVGRQKTAGPGRCRKAMREAETKPSVKRRANPVPGLYLSDIPKRRSQFSRSGASAPCFYEELFCTKVRSYLGLDKHTNFARKLLQRQRLDRHLRNA